MSIEQMNDPSSFSLYSYIQSIFFFVFLYFELINTRENDNHPGRIIRHAHDRKRSNTDRITVNWITAIYGLFPYRILPYTTMLRQKIRITVTIDPDSLDK
jgi:hypothetical protein